MSPCRSPSTPRHLRYRQTGGTSPTDTLTTTHVRDVLFSSREVSTSLFHCPGIVALAGDNSRTTMSPASAFAIATAAAGHGSSQGRQSEPGWGQWGCRNTIHLVKWRSLLCLGFSTTEKTCDKEFIIRRAATNRVLNVLRHWVSKHSQVSRQQVCQPDCRPEEMDFWNMRT